MSDGTVGGEGKGSSISVATLSLDCIDSKPSWRASHLRVLTTSTADPTLLRSLLPSLAAQEPSLPPSPSDALNSPPVPKKQRRKRGKAKAEDSELAAASSTGPAARPIAARREPHGIMTDWFWKELFNLSNNQTWGVIVHYSGSFNGASPGRENSTAPTVNGYFEGSIRQYSKRWPVLEKWAAGLKGQAATQWDGPIVGTWDNGRFLYNDEVEVLLTEEKPWMRSKEYKQPTPADIAHAESYDGASPPPPIQAP